MVGRFQLRIGRKLSWPVLWYVPRTTKYLIPENTVSNPVYVQTQDLLNTKQKCLPSVLNTHANVAYSLPLVGLMKFSVTLQGFHCMPSSSFYGTTAHI
jgi:hypothetical protein